MKKKNLLKTFSVMTLAGAMAFALSGCQMLVDSNGYPTGSAKALASEKITTAEAWEKAFAESNFENYALKQESSVAVISGGEKTVMMSTSIVAKTANKISYAEVTANVLGQSATSYVYADMSGSAPVYYQRVGEGAWELGGADGLGEVSDGTTMKQYASLFAEYEFNEEQKGYVLKEGSTANVDASVVLKFKDGKLVGMYAYELTSMPNSMVSALAEEGEIETTEPADPTDPSNPDPSDPDNTPEQGSGEEEDENTPETPDVDDGNQEGGNEDDNTPTTPDSGNDNEDGEEEPGNPTVPENPDQGDDGEGDGNDDGDNTPEMPETQMEVVMDVVISYGGQNVEIPADVKALSATESDNEGEVKA